MATTWTIAVDWERDGTFTGTYDDISDRYMDANWYLGMRNAYQDIANNSLLRLVVKNDDQYFSPENTTSAISKWLRPYRPIRVSSNDGSTERVHWIGWIETIEPSVNAKGERTAVITANGPMFFLKATETDQPIAEQVRADEVLERLLLEVVKPPAATDTWVVGRSILNNDTKLGKISDLMDLEEGTITLTMVGDNWVHRGASSDERDTFHVYRAIGDLTSAERGRFFFQRDGKAIFWNRDHLKNIPSSGVSFDDSMQGLEYAYAGLKDFKNEIVVACHPRNISATADEILWDLEDPLTIGAGETRTIRAKFEDESGGRVGGRDTSLSYNATSSHLTVTMEAKANSATLKVVNAGTVDATLNSCTIKGQKILDQGRMEALAKDPTAIAQFGRRTMNINASALSDFDAAEAIADYELGQRVSPRGTIQSITLRSHPANGGSAHAHQLARTIGDRITIKETQTNHEADYYIMGEAHRLQAGVLETVWYLEPAFVNWGFEANDFTGLYAAWGQDPVATKDVYIHANNLASQGSGISLANDPYSPLRVDMVNAYEFENDLTDSHGSNDLSVSAGSISHSNGAAIFDGNTVLSGTRNIDLTQPWAFEIKFNLGSAIHTSPWEELMVIGDALVIRTDGTNDPDGTSHLNFWMNDGTAWSSLDVGTVSINTDHHLIGWYDGTTIFAQLDGNTPVSIADTVANNSSNFLISNSSGQTSSTIDTVRIWQRVLTSDERTALYRRGLGVSYPDTETLLQKFSHKIWTLDGVGSNYLNLSASELGLDGTVSFTFSTWVYLTSSTIYNVIGGQWIGTNAWSLLTLDPATNIQALFHDGTQSFGTATHTLALNTWTHLALTYEYISANSVEGKFYANGALVGTITHTAPHANTSGALDLARNALTGYQTHTHLWKRVLSADEISGLYNTI